MTTTVFDRTRKGSQLSAIGSGADPAVFNSLGIAEVSSANEFLDNFGGLELVGVPNLEVALDVAGDSSKTYTVPSGKTWRLLTCVMELTTDSTVANRNLRLRTRNSGDTAIETFSMATQIKDLTVRYQVVFQDNTQGVLRTEPAGKLTIAEQVTAGDTMIINGVTLTFVAVGGITANGQIEIGSNEAGTKTNIDAAIGATRTGGLHSVTDTIFASLDVSIVDFSSDILAITYAGAGSATGDGEALTTTETFTHNDNVFDATTLGGITPGVGAGTKEGSTTFPVNGTLLAAGEDVIIDVDTTQDSGDDVDSYLTYLEYDETIT